MVASVIAYIATAFFLFVALGMFLNAIDMKVSRNERWQYTLCLLGSLALAYGCARLGGI